MSERAVAYLGTIDRPVSAETWRGLGPRAVARDGHDGGVQITASHNPKQYNGMKIVRRNALPLGGDGGIEKVRDLSLSVRAGEKVGGG